MQHSNLFIYLFICLIANRHVSTYRRSHGVDINQRPNVRGSDMYKITTWNINGLRSAKDLKSTLDELDSDIICIQETKITREMLSEPLANVPGYTSYFDFSRRRSGYSGVATYCRQSATPAAAEAGVAGADASDAPGSVGCYGDLPAELEPTERRELDSEGRCMVTLHRTACQCSGASQRSCHVAVLNVYCPRVDPERPDRLTYKLLFYRALRLRAAALCAAGHHVLVVGDLNCSHRPIDSCDPGDLKEFAASPSRRFLDGWLCDPGDAGSCTAPDRLVDAFRLLHPAAADVYTCWNTQSAARQLNYGTRIDYVLCDAPAAAAGLLRRCDVLAEVQGSDHCPVRAEIGAQLRGADRPPPACTRYFPELAGRQLTIKQWCSGQPAGGKRPPPAPSAAQRRDKRARGGQSTLLGFVKRSVPAPAPAPATSSGGSEESQDSTPSDSSQDSTGGVCNGEVAISEDGGALEWDSSGSSCLSTSEESGGGRQKVTAAAAFWSATLRAPRPPPCRGHREPCVQRVVKKAGPNLGKQFWCCARGVGKPGDPEARCGHFEWLRRAGTARPAAVPVSAE